MSRFSVVNFLPHSAKNNREEPFHSFRKFRLSKNFMHNGCYHDFPSKFFIITVPKNFVP